MSINSESEKLSATVPTEWVAKLTHLSEKNGCSLEELVREALAQYLDLNHFSASPDSESASFTTLQKQLVTLTTRVKDLEVLFSQVAKLEAKMFSLERTLMPELSTLPETETFTQFLATDDEQYDEPDEILTDFLT